MKNRILTLLAAGMAALCTACSAAPAQNAPNAPAVSPAPAAAKARVDWTDRDLDGTWQEKEAVQIKLEGADAHIQGSGAQMQNGVLSINAAGVYVLSGSFAGRVQIAAGKEDKVQLVLQNARITAPDGPALYITGADKVFITLAPGSENCLADAAQYTAQGLGDADAALMSTADLAINGTGALEVLGNYNHAIASNDDLKIANAALSIQAVGDGLRGKDLTALRDAAVAITAGGDGIQAHNKKDADRGHVVLQGGSLAVNAGEDGIQAARVLQVNSGALAVTAQGKGLRAGTALRVDGGEISVQSGEDALHSNGDVDITAGKTALTAAGNGLHADGQAAVRGGELTVHNSDEGIEGATVAIEGGQITLTAADDGVNASLPDEADPDSPVWIRVSGGTLNVDAQGDGIDSNGSVEIYGGTVLVSGPDANDNAALDYDTRAAIYGGVFAAAGSAGMAVNFTQAAQPSCLATFAPQTAGTPITLLDARGNALLTFAPARQYASLVVSCPAMQIGQSYTLAAGGVQLYAFTATDTLIGREGFGGPGGERPPMPEGEMPQMPAGERPAPPNGEMPQLPGGEGPKMPAGEMPAPPNGEMPGEPPAKPQ